MRRFQARHAAVQQIMLRCRRSLRITDDRLQDRSRYPCWWFGDAALAHFPRQPPEAVSRPRLGADLLSGDAAAPVPEAGDSVTDPIVVTSDDFRFFARRQAGGDRHQRHRRAWSLRAATRRRRDDRRRQDRAADRMARTAWCWRSPPTIWFPTPPLFRRRLPDGGERRRRRLHRHLRHRADRAAHQLWLYQPGRRRSASPRARKVAAFVEKPDPHHRRGLCLAEGYLWNSGNFIFPAALMIAEAEKFEPEIAAAAPPPWPAPRRISALSASRRPPSWRRRPKSIDYAVLERTDRAAVVEGRFPLVGYRQLGRGARARPLPARERQCHLRSGVAARQPQRLRPFEGAAGHRHRPRRLHRHRLRRRHPGDAHGPQPGREDAGRRPQEGKAATRPTSTSRSTGPGAPTRPSAAASASM